MKRDESSPTSNRVECTHMPLAKASTAKQAGDNVEGNQDSVENLPSDSLNRLDLW